MTKGLFFAESYLLKTWHFLSFFLLAPFGVGDALSLLRRKSAKKPPGSVIWFHLPSLGEANSAGPVIQAILEKWPEVTILVTTNRFSSFSRKFKLPNLPAQYNARLVYELLPVDIPLLARLFIRKWRPCCVFWFEADFWPNILRALHANAIPLCLLQGRMSPRSFNNWQKYAPDAIGHLFGLFDLCLCQSSRDLDFFKRLGARNAIYQGNLKLTLPPLSFDREEAQKLKNAISGRRFWLAASVRQDEFTIMADIQRTVLDILPNTLCLLAPRHPRRAESLEALLTKKGFRVERRSQQQKPPGARADFYIIDSLGELGLFYSLAPLVLMGGSFGKKGGHNVFEAIQHDVAVLHGPENLSPVATILKNENALKVLKSPESMAQHIALLLQEKVPGDEQVKKASLWQKGHTGAILPHILDKILPVVTTALKTAALKTAALKHHAP